MRMRRAGVVAMACSLGAFGCSLLTSLDGLTGGATPIDATVEAATIGDAAVVATGSGDGPTPTGDAGGDARPVDFCAGTDFCDRFERDDVQGSWASAFPNNGGTLAIDKSTFASASRSLAIHVPATGDPHAQLGSNAFPNVAHVRVAFSMKTAAPDRQMALMRLQVSGGGGATFDLFMFDGAMVVSEQGFGTMSAGYFNYPVSGFVADKWQRWTLELDATGVNAVGIATIDGVEAARKTLHNAYPKSDFSVLLGDYYAPNGPTARDVWYDDVSFTILH